MSKIVLLLNNEMAWWHFCKPYCEIKLNLLVRYWSSICLYKFTARVFCRHGLLPYIDFQKKFLWCGYEEIVIVRMIVYWSDLWRLVGWCQHQNYPYIEWIFVSVILLLSICLISWFQVYVHTDLFLNFRLFIFLMMLLLLQHRKIAIIDNLFVLIASFKSET